MTDAPVPVPAPALDAPARTATTPIFVATFAGVLVAIVLLLFLDVFLARIDRNESDAHAASEYAEGRVLLAAGRPSDAAARFGTAVAIDRQNVNYALGLGEAMLEDGQITDAEATLKSLLDRAENDGAVNLTMAHVMLREKRTADAKAYFHRAIFGRWGADSVVRRGQARFELIDMLAHKGESRELLAELLPLEETSPDSVDLRRRLGGLFILAGSPARAATMFREVLRRDPEDATAYAGMGEASLALGNFRTARADLAAALRLRPDDAGIVHSLAVADSVLALDPTARGLSAHERQDRSRTILARTIAVLGACARPGATASLDSARVMLGAGTPSGREEALGDAMLGVATDLWSAQSPACAAAMNDTVLRLVQTHLAQ